MARQRVDQRKGRRVCSVLGVFHGSSLRPLGVDKVWPPLLCEKSILFVGRRRRAAVEQFVCDCEVVAVSAAREGDSATAMPKISCHDFVEIIGENLAQWPLVSGTAWPCAGTGHSVTALGVAPVQGDERWSTGRRRTSESDWPSNKRSPVLF